MADDVLARPPLLLAPGSVAEAEAAELIGMRPLVGEYGALDRDVVAYVWPGHEQVASAGQKAGLSVYVLDPYRLGKYPGPAHYLREGWKNQAGVAAIALMSAIKESVPAGVAVPKEQYVGLFGAALEDLGERLRGPIEAVPTWSPSWNRACGMFGGRVGPAREQYILLAGASGFGKTYCATNLAARVMEEESLSPEWRSPAIHSLEVAWAPMGLRMLSRLSGEPIYRLEPGEMHDPEAFRRAREVADAYKSEGVTVRIPRRPISKLSDLLDSIRYEYEVHGSILHVVDYLQLAWTGDADTQVKQITETSHSLRQLFLDLRLVGVCVSQLKREATSDRTRRPQKEDVLGGSALENDSQQTLILDHSRVERTKGVGWKGWLLLDKNRDGDVVDIPIEFIGRTLTMRERMDDEISDREVNQTPTKRRNR